MAAFRQAADDGADIIELDVHLSSDGQVVVFHDWHVWRTTDGGSNWELRVGSGEHMLPPVQVNSVRFNPYHSRWVYVGTDLGVYASEDKGLTWSRAPLYGEHEGPVNTETAEVFWQAEHLIAATHGRGMYRTRPLDVVHVDGAHGGAEDGSWSHPFNTVLEAVGAAGTNATIAIETGTYNETGVIFSTPGRVVATHGRARIE